MRISRVETFVLLDATYNAASTSSSQDDLVVAIHTDDGLVGYGETDLNPWIGQACIEAPGTHTMGMCLREMLLGKDPLEVERLWSELYTGSAMNGRRGAVIHAMGALDIALHDLRGKALNKPCYEILGAQNGVAPRTKVTPYASLQPEVSGFEAYREALLQAAVDAKEFGFKAAKVEITPFGPYSHRGLRARPEEVTELLHDVRAAVGREFVLMVDVQYAFANADDCLRTIRDWEEHNLYFIETPLPSDDIAGYMRLSREQSIPIAAGEWLATRFEFLDFMDRGGIRVVQPDIGRVGGLTEASRVCQLAHERNLLVVPHLWKTGLSIAAAAHLAAVTPHCPFIEYLPIQQRASALRQKLVDHEPQMVDGELEISERPGLGIELNRDALLEFEEYAQEAVRERTAIVSS